MNIAVEHAAIRADRNAGPVVETRLNVLNFPAVRCTAIDGAELGGAAVFLNRQVADRDVS